MALAYGLGSTPSTAVQLYIPRSLFFTGKGGCVQLIAEKENNMVQAHLVLLAYVCKLAWHGPRGVGWASTQHLPNIPPVVLWWLVAICKPHLKRLLVNWDGILLLIMAASRHLYNKADWAGVGQPTLERIPSLWVASLLLLPVYSPWLCPIHKWWDLVFITKYS